MKAVPVLYSDGKEYRCESEMAHAVYLNFPSSEGVIRLPVMLRGTRRGTPNWTWNGDTERPTLRPSVRTKTDVISHSWVNDGKVQYLGDSTNGLAGKTVDLLDVPDWVIPENEWHDSKDGEA